MRAGLRAIETVRAAHPDEFGWRRSGEGYWLDLLLGTDRIRRGIEAGIPSGELMDAGEPAVRQFLEERRPHLLYPEP